ncbi:hypothetical protein MUK42_34803 [Musa troglodytarum]|uniref:Uncharacterized protein n=1 Tax=Musa troglodytarum TaxID=320322 RepID=A0A9E7KAY3_9LILI|nr:hypothetical protein MUK42_34803 [Musa troglodytarum]
MAASDDTWPPNDWTRWRCRKAGLKSPLVSAVDSDTCPASARVVPQALASPLLRPPLLRCCRPTVVGPSQRPITLSSSPSQRAAITTEKVQPKPRLHLAPLSVLAMGRCFEFPQTRIGFFSSG